jgi:tetratricopeptide (TPR) repeat protein
VKLSRPLSALAAGALLAVTAPALALDPATARGRADIAIRAVEAEAAKGPDPSRFRFPPPTPAERVAAGDMLLRTKDYEPSIATLSKVLELHRQGSVQVSAYADATFLIAEAYFQSGQYLSARRHYREVLEKGLDSSFSLYVGRSMSRLVDVALRTGDLDGLDFVFARLGSLPASDTSGSLGYARAKALFARRDYPAAKAAAQAVPTSSERSASRRCQLRRQARSRHSASTVRRSSSSAASRRCRRARLRAVW